MNVEVSDLKLPALDLQLSAKVQKSQLRAPGKLTLLAGIPQRALLSAMSKRYGRVELQFTLTGRLDDPNFSLNEDAATRMASALAQTLGVSMGGVVEGVGSVIKGLLGR